MTSRYYLPENKQTKEQVEHLVRQCIGNIKNPGSQPGSEKRRIVLNCLEDILVYYLIYKEEKNIKKCIKRFSKNFLFIKNKKVKDIRFPPPPYNQKIITHFIKWTKFEKERGNISDEEFVMYVKNMFIGLIVGYITSLEYVPDFIFNLHVLNMLVSLNLDENTLQLKKDTAHQYFPDFFPPPEEKGSTGATAGPIVQFEEINYENPIYGDKYDFSYFKSNLYYKD